MIGCFPGSITGWMIEYDNWRVTGRMFSTTGGREREEGKGGKEVKGKFWSKIKILYPSPSPSPMNG